jgi:hypothetical protein
MAFVNGLVSVGTTATLICTVGADSDGVLIQNNGTVPVFIGASTVTTSGATSGVQVAANATATVPTTAADPLALYGIVTTGTANVTFLFCQ